MKIRKRINPGLGIAGILMTMCESRTKLCKVLTEEVTENFQEQIRVFETRIPSTVKVGGEHLLQPAGGGVQPEGECGDGL